MFRMELESRSIWVILNLYILGGEGSLIPSKSRFRKNQHLRADGLHLNIATLRDGRKS